MQDSSGCMMAAITSGFTWCTYSTGPGGIVWLSLQLLQLHQQLTKVIPALQLVQTGSDCRQQRPASTSHSNPPKAAAEGCAGELNDASAAGCDTVASAVAAPSMRSPRACCDVTIMSREIIGLVCFVSLSALFG